MTKNQVRRKEAADERHAHRATLTPQEQIKELDRRPGNSLKERKRLHQALEALKQEIMKRHE